MYQNYQYEVDPKDPFKPLYQGTFEETVEVGGKTRRYLLYIPEGARPSTAGVFVLPENGKTADDLWRESGWRMIADTEETKEKLILFFLEPENGKWQLDEPYAWLYAHDVFRSTLFRVAGRQVLLWEQRMCGWPSGWVRQPEQQRWLCR